MGRLSRRSFVSGIAAGVGTAGVVASAVEPGSLEPQQTGGHASEVRREERLRHDVDVAKFYCAHPPRQLLDLTGKDLGGPHSGVFLYGLVCAVLHMNDAKNEVLLPTAEKHTPMLFSSAPWLGDPGEYFGEGIYGWSLAGYSLTWTPLKADDTPASFKGDKPKKVDRSLRHPWSRFEAVRSLKKLTKKNIILESERVKPQNVTSRVSITDAVIEALVPLSLLGREGEFEANDESGSNPKKDVAATTDTLLAVHQWSPETAKIKINLTPFNGTVQKALEVVFSLRAPSFQALFAITHASEDPPAEGVEPLDHTRAFGRLLGLDPAKYPVPSLKRGNHGKLPEPGVYPPTERGKTSSKDGHCEASWDG